MWHASEDWRNEKYQALYQSINENQEALTLGIRRGDETLTVELPGALAYESEYPRG